MKKSFLLVLLGATMCCTAMADKKPSKKPAATTTKSQSAFTSGQEGLFGVLRRDADYFFDIPDSLLSRRFLATVRFTSTPAGTGKYGGESVNQQTVYWEPAPGNVMLLRSDLMVNMGNSMDAIDRAVKTSNNSPIIGTFKIEGHRNGHYLVKSRHSSMKITLPWVSVGTSKKNLACKDTCRKHHTLKASRHFP